MAETNYTRLFGTPEKTMQTMAGKCGDCCECVISNACRYGCDAGCLLSTDDEESKKALLRWLEKEAE